MDTPFAAKGSPPKSHSRLKPMRLAQTMRLLSVAQATESK
jgi:hypothetical protein